MSIFVIFSAKNTKSWLMSINNYIHLRHNPIMITIKTNPKDAFC